MASFLYWKAHKKATLRVENLQKRQTLNPPNPPSPDTYHSLFPDDGSVLTLDIFWSRQFLNSHRLTYSPTMAPPPPPTDHSAPSHLHARHPHGLFQAPIFFAVSQVQRKLQILKTSFHKVIIVTRDRLGALQTLISKLVSVNWFFQMLVTIWI
jgi:hypothetical protein